MLIKGLEAAALELELVERTRRNERKGWIEERTPNCSKLSRCLLGLRRKLTTSQKLLKHGSMIGSIMRRISSLLFMRRSESVLPHMHMHR